MAGNKAGGLKTKAKNTENDPDYYKRLGHLGGKAPRKQRPFQADRELAIRAGRLGGLKSRRRPKIAE